MKKPILFNNPNKFAPKLGLDYSNGAILVKGYQQYIVYKDSIKPDSNSYDLLTKYILLKDVLNEDIAGKTILDLGANSGFFTFLSYQNGGKCTAIDLDPDYINIINEVSNYFNFNILIKKQNITDVNHPSDIVIALSLIHWVYSCTSIFNSMEKLVLFFRSVTKEHLIIEWIDNEDNAIKCFNHLDHNSNFTNNTYNHQEFMKQMNIHFTKIVKLGETRKNTRLLYKASV